MRQSRTLSVLSCVLGLCLTVSVHLAAQAQSTTLPASPAPVSGPTADPAAQAVSVAPAGAVAQAEAKNERLQKEAEAKTQQILANLQKANPASLPSDLRGLCLKELSKIYYSEVFELVTERCYSHLRRGVDDIFAYYKQLEAEANRTISRILDRLDVLDPDALSDKFKLLCRREMPTTRFMYVADVMAQRCEAQVEIRMQRLTQAGERIESLINDLLSGKITRERLAQDCSTKLNDILSETPVLLERFKLVCRQRASLIQEIKDAYGRGVGLPNTVKGRSTCNTRSGTTCELDGLLLYPPCRNGYVGVGPVCWKQR